jgi:endonuclease YncB( thermonuclease family)
MLRSVFVGSFLVLLSTPTFADTLSGHPTVTDGDTFRFKGGLKVRLFGVDTPEKNQKCEMKNACVPCGQEAANFVRTFIGDNELVCELTGDKTYDRYVAICAVGKKDLGEAIIAAGYGFPYRQFLKGHKLEGPYTAAEKLAQSKRRGLNQGRFIPPADWRTHKMRLECERS